MSRHIEEGKIIIFEGKQRTGKTLGASIYCFSERNKGRNILSNIEFKFDFDWCKFKELTIKAKNKELQGSVIFIDELNFYFDARASMTKGNREASYFLLQVKKQGVDLVGTTHSISLLDKRFRDNYDYLIRTSVYPEVRPADTPPSLLKWQMENGPAQKRMNKTFTFDFTKKPGLLGLYDTNNIVNPFAE